MDRPPGGPQPGVIGLDGDDGAAMPLSPDPHRRSNEFGRGRDRQICWLLSMHPATAAMLVSLSLFPTVKKARKRLARLALCRRIRLVGSVCRKSGRPEHVYCTWRPQAQQLLHEVELTQLCLRLDAGNILRGPHVKDDRIRPDAEVWIRGRLYYLELDRGTMSLRQIDGRFRKYEECRHLVLWVCATAERREALRQRAERLRQSALFASLAEAVASPHWPIWQDYTGQRAALPRESEQ